MTMRSPAQPTPWWAYESELKARLALEARLRQLFLLKPPALKPVRVTAPRFRRG